jgi:hypothetical protein
VRIVVYQGEKTVTDLVDRLYSVKRASRRTRRLERDLLKINPHLDDLSRVPKGTIIFVPDVHGVESREESLPDLVPGVRLLDETRRTFEAIGDLLHEAANRTSVEEEQTKLLKYIEEEFSRLQPILGGHVADAAVERKDLLAALVAAQPRASEATGADGRAATADENA